MLSYVLALIAAIVFGIFFWRRMQAKQVAIAANRDAVTQVIESILKETRSEPIVTAGVESWRGDFNGEQVQVRTIVDTLATRKLPALWLSVTVNEQVNIAATFDMMARPNSATTFSNYELLAHSVKLPAGYPAFAGVRTDDINAPLPFDVIGRHVNIFDHTKTKELLITPNGVRIVVLAAEADRARYGVFRQADFSGFVPDADMIKRLITASSALRADLNEQQKKAAA